MLCVDGNFKMGLSICQMVGGDLVEEIFSKNRSDCESGVLKILGWHGVS